MTLTVLYSEVSVCLSVFLFQHTQPLPDHCRLACPQQSTSLTPGRVVAQWLLHLQYMQDLLRIAASREATMSVHLAENIKALVFSLAHCPSALDALLCILIETTVFFFSLFLATR
ncbi:hypothetical protein E2C01_084659 [Portunus trituberculatus]|uniref:Uncharacterized protein n=1 Tax=Portunus trituberculatus TaxID=210409 RepID=A0A5B7J0K7_PORTR|nr:hypothetical protein [Portunus trituberculatus]